MAAPRPFLSALRVLRLMRKCSVWIDRKPLIISIHQTKKTSKDKFYDCWMFERSVFPSVTQRREMMRNQ